MLDAIADFVIAHVDLDAIGALARVPTLAATDDGTGRGAVPPPGQRIAVARDAAFSFFYPHLAGGWRAAGAELVTFSPLADEAPPDDCDCCWLPGGYPELHAGALAAAERFKGGLRRFAQTRPVHGECGGYMVLGQILIDAEGVAHPMAGLLGAFFSYAKRRMKLGYREATLAADCVLGRRGTVLRGHEFHYATELRADPPDPPLAEARDASGTVQPDDCGSRRGHVTGGFFHVIARHGVS